MNASHASLAKPTIFFCNGSFPSRYSTFPTQFRSKPASKSMGYSVPYLKIPSCGYFAGRRRMKLPVYSQFRRPSRRRNSLREKLVPRQDQVRLFLEVSNTESNFEDLGVRDRGSDARRLGVDFDREKGPEGAEDSKKFDFSGSSALLDKLDNWVGRYKEDSEFWGIGAGPIFTIFQSSDGNVTRASVNEDEILKRNRIRAWSLEGNEEGGELKDVNSKISIARLIAKEIEVGAYQMPRNSSIARFVVEEKKSSLVGILHALSPQRESLIRIFPRIGFMVLCCFCVLGAVRKLFVGYNDVELTREEAEMLRRKKKSRMEREELQRGSVQVLQNGHELPVISGTMPQLDRNELMKSVMQANKSRGTVVVSNPSDLFTAENNDFDKKVREIRDMVRKVHEAEHKIQSSKNNTDEKDELPSIIADTEIPTGVVENHADHKAQTAKESSRSHSDQEENTVIYMDVKDMNTLGEEMAISTGEFSKGELLNNFGTRRSNNVDDIKGQEISILKNSEGLPVGRHMADPRPPDTVSLSNKQEVEMNKVDNNSVRGERTIKGSSVITTNKKGRAKIITSLKEAKEFLSTKGRFHKDSVQPEQLLHLKGASEVLSNCSDRSDGNVNKIRKNSADENVFCLPQGSLGNIVSDFNDKNNINNNKPLSPIVSDFKLYENDNEITNSSAETEGIKEKKTGFQNGDSNGGTQVLTVDGAVDLDDFQMGHNAGIINPSNDCITSGTKNHNETAQHYQNQRYSDHTSQNKQAAKSKAIQSDNSSLSGIVDQVNKKMLKSLSHTQEMNTLQGDSISNETEVEKDGPTITASNFLRLAKSTTKPQSKPSAFSINSDCSLEKDRDDIDVSNYYPVRTSVSGKFDPVADNVSFDASKAEDSLNDLSSQAGILSNSGNSNCQNEDLPKTCGKSWIEENFQQFDSVINKIGHGFKDNYMLAKVKAQENTFSSPDISKLGLWGEDEELEWMKDENLREIVFQVRENELAGKDPFHLMDAEDQKAFFQGLERKAEKANEKLAGVHEWIHSRIENLDYGADGISIDDPLEKIIPRWKGPPIDQDPEFLKKFSNIGILDDILGDKPANLQKSQNLANSDAPYSPVNDRVILSQNGTSTTPKTLIECSDGSNRPGKKNRKEHWEHTKKWSQGFLEVYNSETDPEVKSILKDMGKDLDRWITEKEKKDVADLMTRIPKKKRRFIEKKVNKIKREVDKYGAQAVVSKYKEYAGEKEEDYLWWLDLQFVLCIELYSVEDDVPRIGFYSLEMAEDLELNPKQFHVIAFEDPGDSKNFCHIVQAQMDMLGSGKAFVVARPPKDAFREAKANGFSITVIRKGEVKLNVDQTLEEVEEDLKEVGSKIYHDKIMNERGVDIRSLMKGVIAANKSNKRMNKS